MRLIVYEGYEEELSATGKPTGGICACGELVGSPRFLATLMDSGLTEDEAWEHVANKSLPVGTKYEITDTGELPLNEFRNAWVYASGPDEKVAVAFIQPATEEN